MAQFSPLRQRMPIFFQQTPICPGDATKWSRRPGLQTAEPDTLPRMNGIISAAPAAVAQTSRRIKGAG